MFLFDRGGGHRTQVLVARAPVGLMLGVSLSASSFLFTPHPGSAHTFSLIRTPTGRATRPIVLNSTRKTSYPRVDLAYK